jgi:hypothetical protein
LRVRAVLHKVVRENLETFLAEVREGDPGGAGSQTVIMGTRRRV